MGNLENIKALEENVPEINKKVCVFGQGFVGLPLTLSFAIRGCEAIGVDTDENLVNDINNGITHHTEKFDNVPIQDILRMKLDNKKYKATVSGKEAVQKCNNIIITVGIPIKQGKYIDEYLKSASECIGENLKKGDLVVVRSTVIPGITEDFVKPILEEKSSMTAGKDFYLAYSSERIAEGKAFDEFANMPTLVAGINEESFLRAADLLSVVCKAEIVKASNIKAVETSKVFENVQRDVNIAMVQEFSRFTEALGIDIFEVVKLANTHKRVNLLTPGPGVGGYCIPNAYHYIAPKAEEIGVNMDLLKLARFKNADIPQFIVSKIEELLEKQGKKLNESSIAVLGLAMKDYSNDDRISPPIDICRLLIKAGADVKAFDPIVPTKYDFKYNSQDEVLKDSDVVLVLTKQNGIDFNNLKHMSQLMNNKPIYFDTKKVADKEEAESFGFIYWRI